MPLVLLLIYFLLPSVILIRALAHMGLPKDEVLEQSNKIIDDQYRSLARLLETNHKTVVGYTFRSLDERLIRGLMDLGIPVFQGPERAARALGALREYYRLRDHLSARPPPRATGPKIQEYKFDYSTFQLPLSDKWLYVDPECPEAYPA